MRLAIAGEYKRFGYSDQEVIDLFRSQSDFEYDVCSDQVESVDPEKTATCQSIKEYGYCLPDCQLEKPILLGHINDIENPELSGSPVSVEAVVSSTSTSYMIPSEIEALTKEDNQEPETENQILKIDNPVNLALVGIQDETKLNRLKRMFKGKVLSIGIKRYRTVYLGPCQTTSFNSRETGNQTRRRQRPRIQISGHVYRYRQTLKFSALRDS